MQEQQEWRRGREIADGWMDGRSVGTREEDKVEELLAGHRHRHAVRCFPRQHTPLPPLPPLGPTHWASSTNSLPDPAGPLLLLPSDWLPAALIQGALIGGDQWVL